MKLAGLFIVVVGIVCVVFALNMTVFVETGFGRVANISLMEERRIYIGLSISAIVVGLALFIASQFVKKEVKTSEGIQGSRDGNIYIKGGEIDLNQVLSLANELRQTNKQSSYVSLLERNKSKLEGIKSTLPNNLKDDFDLALKDYLD